MDLQAFTQDRFIYCKWCWFRIAYTEKNNINDFMVDDAVLKYL